MSLWHYGVWQVCSSSGPGSLLTTWDVADTQCSCSCPLSGSGRLTTASHNALPFHLTLASTSHIDPHDTPCSISSTHDVPRSTAQKDTVLESQYVRYSDCSEHLSGLCLVYWISSPCFWHVLYLMYGQRACIYIWVDDCTRWSGTGSSRAEQSGENNCKYCTKYVMSCKYSYEAAGGKRRARARARWGGRGV